MSRIAVFGAGGMGRELADILRASGQEDIVFVLDRPENPVIGVDVITPEDLRFDDQLIVALGSSKDRRAVVERIAHTRYATIISDYARASPHAFIGEGSLFCDFAVINTGSRVGRHFQANCYAQISHDCLIGDFVTFAPHVSCNGWVEIGDDVFVGAGAVIRNGTPGQRLRIGAGATIGMGAVVTEPVPPGAVVAGNPARRLG